MLSICAIGHTAAQVGYYATLGSAENHDYYSEDGVRPGRWWGAGAAQLGLEGVVSPAVFANVLQGRSPDGERQLVQQNDTATRKRRAGFDLTWSVPKSLSVLWSQLNDEGRAAVDEVIERAVYRSLDAFVELCGVARRGKNGHTQEAAQPVIALFSHDTARAVPGEAPDASRHHHAVVANVCVRPDGTTGALDARVLFSKRMKMALGALFRAELSSLLESELGLGSYRPETGRKKKVASWWEVVGVPAGVVDAMSKRRKAIERWLSDHGQSGAKAAEAAAVSTRTGKERHTWRELNTAWATLGSKHGFGPKEARSVMTNAKVWTERPDLDVAAAAVERLSSSRARFTENEVLEAAAIEAQTNRIGIDGVLSSVRRLLNSSPEIVRLADKGGVRAYTTRSMLRVEERLLATAKAMSLQTRHPVPTDVVAAEIRRARTLRPEQCKSVWAVTTGADVVSVTGVAGSGKTFMLSVARAAMERSGYSVIGTALASKAARELEKGSGIASSHLHSLFAQLDLGEMLLTPKSVIVVDEAGMVGTVMMERLLAAASAAGAKVVLVGDHRQLQAIDAGSPFRMVSERVGTTELIDVVRQREPWARETVLDFRDGEAARALAAFHSRGRLRLAPDRSSMHNAVVADWVKLIETGRGVLKDTVVFAGTNAEVQEVNAMIQQAVREAGGLGEHAVVIDDVKLHLGDRVIVTRNNRLLGLRNGTLGEIVGAWGSCVRIATEGGFEVEVDTQQFADLDLAYCLGVHKSQGATVENALFLAGDCMTTREMAYVAASRARGMTVVYADTESVADIPELASRMAEPDQNEMAIEHLRGSST